jgi:SprT protein
MPKEKVPLNTLRAYLPPNAFDPVEALLQKHRVQLTVTKNRATILGDYRPANGIQGHRISVNGGLNPFAFLITLLHELAHLNTFLEYGHRIAPHGPEWKRQFGNLLNEYIKSNLFPSDIRVALEKTLKNPAASSCGDLELMRVLDRYSPAKPDLKRIEELESGSRFQIKGGRTFIRGEKRRTRYLCEEVGVGKQYLFPAIYAVRVILDVGENRMT